MSARRLIALAFVLALAPRSAARAQDTPSTPSTPSTPETTTTTTATTTAQDESTSDLEALLDERIVTTASRGAERASSAPSTVYSITARELQIYGIRTIDEALSYLGIGMYSMRARDYTSGLDVGAQGLMLRDAGRHILVLLDGHVMNSQDTGTVTIHEGLGVPLEAIDHIEVMLGAGSVMYGSNAMLAVINVITRGATRGTQIYAVAELGIAPPQGTDGQPTVPSQPDDRVGLRYRLGLGATSAFSLLGSTAELSIQAEWLEEISNSYRVPLLTDDGQQFRPGQTTWGGAATHSMQAPSIVASLRVGDFTLRIQANHFYRNIPLAGVFSDPRAYEERDAMRIDLRHQVTLAPEVSLSTRLYADYTSQTERTLWTSPYWCPDGQIDGCDYRGSSVGRWAGIEQVLTLDWLRDSSVVTTVGYDIRARDATARPADYHDLLTGAPAYGLATPYLHQVTTLGAVFLQQVYRPWQWLTINLGGRLDVDSNFGARLSPRAALIVTPADGTSIRASYSEAFRAPTSYELYEWDPTYIAQARGLGPEVVRVGELEWQQRIEWITFSLRGFAAFYEDFIDFRPVTQAEFDAASAAGQLARSAQLDFVVRHANIQALRSFGGSASFSLRPAQGLTLAGSVTVSDTRPTNPDASHPDLPIVLQPLWSGNARIAYEFATDGASIALATVFAGRRVAFDDILALSRHEVGEQIDLRLTVASPIDPVPGLRFRATVSYAVNPFLPYILDAPTDASPSAPVVYQTVTSTLFGFLGLQYVYSL